VTSLAVLQRFSVHKSAHDEKFMISLLHIDGEHWLIRRRFWDGVGGWGWGWNKEDEGEISADGTKVRKVLQNIEEELG
jgi:hypothetical protein